MHLVVVLEGDKMRYTVILQVSVILFIATACGQQFNNPTPQQKFTSDDGNQLFQFPTAPVQASSQPIQQDRQSTQSRGENRFTPTNSRTPGTKQPRQHFQQPSSTQPNQNNVNIQQNSQPAPVPIPVHRAPIPVSQIQHQTSVPNHQTKLRTSTVAPQLQKTPPLQGSFIDQFHTPSVALPQHQQQVASSQISTPQRQTSTQQQNVFRTTSQQFPQQPVRSSQRVDTQNQKFVETTLSPEQLLFMEQAKNAKYNFQTGIDDRINSNTHIRQETRDGLNLTGFYSYSDGYFKRTVHYVADENGYRVTQEEVEEIGDGPVQDLNGDAIVYTNIGGIENEYQIFAKDLRSLETKIERKVQPISQDF